MSPFVVVIDGSSRMELAALPRWFVTTHFQPQDPGEGWLRNPGAPPR